MRSEFFISFYIQMVFFFRRILIIANQGTIPFLECRLRVSVFSVHLHGSRLVWDRRDGFRYFGPAVPILRAINNFDLINGCFSLPVFWLVVHQLVGLNANFGTTENAFNVFNFLLVAMIICG